MIWVDLTHLTVWLVGLVHHKINGGHKLTHNLVSPNDQPWITKRLGLVTQLTQRCDPQSWVTKPLGWVWCSTVVGHLVTHVGSHFFYYSKKIRIL